MKKLLLILPFLALGGCAGVGAFTGAAFREAARPDYIYVQPRPYFQPYYQPSRPYWGRRHGW